MYDVPGMGWMQTAKGWFYVLATAAVLYPLTRRWERHLRRSEERYRALFDGGSDAAFVFLEAADGSGAAELVEANRAACEWLGYHREELLAMAPANLAARAPWPYQGDAASAGAPPGLFETDLVTRDGRRIPVEVSTRRFTLDGRPTVLAIARDIGERRNAGQALRVRDAALNTSIAGMVSIGLDGAVTYANQSFARMWGYENDAQVLGLGIDALIASAEQASEIGAELRRTGRWAGEAPARRRDGTLFDAQVWASMVYGDDGEPISAAAWAIDITERLRAERALRDSEESAAGCWWRMPTRSSW